MAMIEILQHDLEAAYTYALELYVVFALLSHVMVEHS